ncbi:MAG: AI-2E family transporter [Acidobacteriota bacterium]|nr:AI-2E family transporter [Acidobacteriota bacterium]
MTTLGVDFRAARYTWTAALVLLFLLCVYTIRGTLFIFVISLLFAYLLYPLVDIINRFVPSQSRTPALAIVYLLLIGLLVFLGIEIGSKVAEQANSLAQRAPEFISKMEQPVNAPIPGAVRGMKETIIGAVRTQFLQHYNDIAKFLPRIGLEVLSYSKDLIYLIIIPILSFFILKDGREIRDEFLGLIEKGRPRELMDDILADVHSLLLQYMRALLILCGATLTVFSIVFSIMGVPYALLLASIAFPLEFIPVVGPLAAAVIVIAVVALSGFPHLLWVIIFLGCYRLFQDYVLSPNLMSAGIELHPLLVLFGVFAGGEIGGIAGTFLSVPVLALVRILYIRIRKSRVMAPPSVLARA